MNIIRTRYPTSRFIIRTFYQTSSIKNEKKSNSSYENDQNNLPAGISPWARFMDVLKSEYAKSQQMQENVRELTGTAQGIKDSEAAQRMRKAYTAMRLETLIKENPKLATMAKSLSNTGKSVTEAVNKVANEIEESKIIQATKKLKKEFDKRITEPIKKTEVYKVVEDTIDFNQGALRYGGYIEKDERKRRRQKRLERLAKYDKNLNQNNLTSINPQSTTTTSSSSKISSNLNDSSITSTHQKDKQIMENPNAPPALVLHATANEHQASSEKEANNGSKISKGMKSIWETVQLNYEESENPLVSTLRSMTGFIKRNVFDETETAKVIRLIKQVDPEFNYDQFLVDLREFIVPDFVDSFVENDLKSLKIWTSEAAYNLTTAPMIMYLQRGLRPANQIIDLKGIDIISAKVLEERDLPVFIVGFKTHEINCYINPNKKKQEKSIKKTSKQQNEEENQMKQEEDEVEVGSRDEINQVQYVVILTKEVHLNPSSTTDTDDDNDENNDNNESTHSTSNPSQKNDLKDQNLELNHITGGWKIIDLARRSSVAFL